MRLVRLKHYETLFQLAGTGRYVDDIVFYGEGVVVATTRRFSTGENNISSIVFPFEAKRAVKVNLNRKDCYWKPVKDDTERCVLYIHEQLVGLETISECNVPNGWYCDLYERTLRFSVPVVIVKNDKPETETHFQFKIVFKVEETDEMLRCREKAQRIKDKTGVDISEWQMHDILQHFRITERRAVRKH